jgi:hypothetical protein
MKTKMREFSQLAESEKFIFLGIELEKMGPDLARDEPGRPWCMESHDLVTLSLESELLTECAGWFNNASTNSPLYRLD